MEHVLIELQTTHVQYDVFLCMFCSSVQQLALLGQSLGIRMPPLYEHQYSNDGRCQARVVFNNMTYVGSLARTYDQAVESAASLALFNLVHLSNLLLSFS